MPLRNDDPNIADDAVLWRRIPDTPICVYKAEDGTVTPSSANFLDEIENELSVDLASLTTTDKVLKNHEQFGLAAVTARVPRENKHIVDSDPIIDQENPENNNPAHCVICAKPELSSNKGRKKAARNIANKSKWVIYPESYRQ